MKRRDFLKGALMVSVLAPFSRLAAKAEKKVAAKPGAAIPSKVVRRTLNGMETPLLGYGTMRLPRKIQDEPDIDYAKAEQLFKRAMESGVNYFDTAYFYHRGLSEKCVGDLLSKYPRNSYILADKMPVRMLKKEADMERIFNEQLKRCRTSFFDFYLMHALNGRNWKTAQRLKLYDFLKQKQREGKIRYIGFSFHDKPAVLKEIAGAYKWDFAQIQLNYFDWINYKSKEQYEILTSLNIPVIVMEPLRGGALARLNDEARAIFKRADKGATPASWAFRYAGSLPNVLCVLSGMTEMEHLEDNIKTFSSFAPLTKRERGVIAGALAAYRKKGAVPCTDCRYCLPCPAGVAIPKVFSLYNDWKYNGNFEEFNKKYSALPTEEQASECISCMACVKKCPQSIAIPKELERITKELTRQKKKNNSK